MTLVCVGEVMAEIRSDDSDGFAVGFAGDTFNVAVYCQRNLGPDHPVAFHTRIGRDPLSQGFLSFAAGEDLDLGTIERDEKRNIGIYAVQTDAAGERTFAYWRNQSAARGLFDEGGLDALDGFSIVYLSGITLAIVSPEARARFFDWIVAQKAKGVRFAFDSNFRPSLWESVETARETITRAWQLADIGFPSVDDEMNLYGDVDAESVLARLRDYGCTEGALKRGSTGPVGLNPATERRDYPSATSVVDTTAAGDSFNGAYLAAVLSGSSEIDALSAGHNQAIKVIGARGAIIPR